MEFELEIRGVSLAQIPGQVGSIRYGGQQDLTKTQAPRGALVFHDDSPGVASRVGGVVVSPVLVDRPVHKLKVTVAANGVDVEKVAHRELADAQLQPREGNSEKVESGPRSAWMRSWLRGITW